jgi:hypothetical protein
MMVQRGRQPRADDYILEREAADYVALHMKGFGPKQS